MRMERSLGEGEWQMSGLFYVFLAKNAVSFVLLLCYCVRRIRCRSRSFQGQPDDNDTLRMIPEAEREDNIDDYS